MPELDGKLVRVVTDIFDNGKIIVSNGQTFIWDDSTTDQNIDGELIFIEPDEVEIVKNPKLQIEGNGGGDYLDLEVVSDGLIKISVGHCSVKTIDAFLPVEVITAIISDWLFKGANGNIEQGIKKVWEGNDKAAQKYIEIYRQANQVPTESLTFAKP